jgi:transcriptional regulator with XRE-family HTH domain
MRNSPLRHNLARLRLFLGLGQKEMADLADCSTRAIQSVELGTLALSESLARKISNATGIDAGWLLENNLKAPLITDHGYQEPFTVEDYNQRRSDRELGIIRPVWAPELRTIAFYAWMRAIFATKDGNIALWQTGKFLEKLAKKYGHNKSILSTSRLELSALLDGNLLRQHTDIGAKFVTEKYRDLWETPGEGCIRIQMRIRQKRQRSAPSRSRKK